MKLIFDLLDRYKQYASEEDVHKHVEAIGQITDQLKDCEEYKKEEKCCNDKHCVTQ